MPYLISFLEGLITFISPCLLPMLPITLSYFAGNTPDGGSRTLKNALGFSAGFTLVFMTMGVFAGTIGRFLQRWQTWIHLVTGAVVVLFGLSFLACLNCAFPRWAKQPRKKLSASSRPRCLVWCFPSAGRPVSARFWAPP
jgi:cytochrome c-type biogenesis protein